MTRFKFTAMVVTGLLVFGVAGVWFYQPAAALGPSNGGGPYSSQPLALSWDNSLLAVANPDSNTVSIFLVQADQNYKIAEVPVGKEPVSVAFSPDATRLYIANRVDGTVSVVSKTPYGTYGAWQVSQIITVGTEPYGMVLSATGRKLYVTNTQSSSVSVIDITLNQVINTIPNVAPLPRGIAITHGPNIAESSQVVYVTDFLALPSGADPDGFDDAKAGFVTAISVANDSVIGTIKLNPVADTGFKAAGNAVQHIAPPATPVAADFKFTTGAYPNQLNGIATYGNFAYVPSTGASPNGPVRFNVNMQSLLSLINLSTNQDAGETINIQSAVFAQTNPKKLFVTQPWAIAFRNSSAIGYVASAASNVVVKLAIDPTSGKPTVQTDPNDPTSVFEIPVGRNPRGILINSADSRAYVMNYISRDVTVIDLTQPREQVLATFASTAVPQPGTLADKIQIGKELFNTSVGIFDSPPGSQTPITGRMSNSGWGSCSACHPEGLSDNVVWIFATGPRRTVPLHATFAPGDPTQQRALNWSAIFDEIPDFEANIRLVSGGLGMMVQADGITPDTQVPAFIPAAAGQKQLTVRGVGGWDAITAYIQSGIRAPISPLSKQDPDVLAGQKLFTQANCQSCHGTSQWTTSRVRYTPPPSPALIQNGELINELFPVGTFNPGALNEVRANALKPLGADGFNPPSLLSIFAFPQTFFHNGSAATLDDVLANAAHRTAGSGGVDFLSDPGARGQLVRFLLSIDGNTPPADATSPLPGLSQGGIVNAASFNQAVAPGSIASVFGLALAASRQSASQTPLPVTLGNATLTIGGVAAPEFFASRSQLNVQIPWETAPGNAAASIAVNSQQGAGTATVAQYAPGVFTTTQTGTGQGVIIGSSGGLAAPAGAFPGSEPAHAGDVVTVYCTGLGPVRNQPATGAVASASPLPATTTPASMTIGGLPATVSYSGLTPGAVGLYQVNVKVPVGVTAGGSVPLILSIGGTSANTVTLAVE